MRAILVLVAALAFMISAQPDTHAQVYSANSYYTNTYGSQGGGVAYQGTYSYGSQGTYQGTYGSQGGGQQFGSHGASAYNQRYGGAYRASPLVTPVYAPPTFYGGGRMCINGVCY